MNKPTASSEAHVVVARRPGNVPVLSWTNICRLPSTKSEKNRISTASGPTSSLQKNNFTYHVAFEGSNLGHVFLAYTNVRSACSIHYYLSYPPLLQRSAMLLWWEHELRYELHDHECFSNLVGAKYELKRGKT
jgi:hypothetical protein